MTRTDIRIALPSKGALAEDSLVLLAEAGLKVRRPNPRQYQATIPALPGVTVIFQRPGDIVVGVRQGSIDFGITGYDILAEKGNVNGDQPILLLHDALGYGHCTLNLAVPEDVPVRNMAELQAWAEELAGNGRPLRIATKFPHTTAQFLAQTNIQPVKLIDAEGTLEIAPAVGYADLIADLVSSGITLRDNHLRILDDGEILRSQAVLIANRAALTGAISERTRQWNKADLLSACEKQGVPAGPINDMEEVFADPQIMARGMQITCDGVPGVRSPMSFSGAELATGAPSPKLGEHDAEIRGRRKG